MEVLWNYTIVKMTPTVTLTLTIRSPCLPKECKNRYSRSSRKWTPLGVKKASVTGAGRLRECENTEFVWEFNKTGF